MKRTLLITLLSLGIFRPGAAQTSFADLAVTSSLSLNNGSFLQSNNGASVWKIVHTSGGNLSFFPAHDYQSRSIVFQQSGAVAFPRAVTVGDVTSPGILGINNLSLAVGGKVGARSIHVVATSYPWPDYVFGPDYRLPPLAEVEQYVQANGHLPAIPTAATVAAQGQDVGRIQALLLQKVEELTLYLIALRKENDALQARMTKLETR